MSVRNYLRSHRYDFLLKINTLILIVLVSFSACGRKNLWENNYSNILPEVRLTSASAVPGSHIYMTWNDPASAVVDHIEIESAFGIFEEETDIGNYTISNTGIADGTEYTVTVRTADVSGNTSTGVSFSITPSGSGTNGYFIYTREDLNAVRGGNPAGSAYELWTLADTYYLMADIDLNGYDPSGDGYGWVPIGYSLDFSSSVNFSGTFEGNGHAIRNLTINRSTLDQTGLFRRLNGGKIRNVNLINININGNQYTGGLIGYNENSGSVSGCSAAGTITAASNYTGGLIGYNSGCSVSSSHSEITIISAGTGIGGLIGVNYTGPITDCHSICSITATFAGAITNIGGLVSYTTGDISGSYASGTITASGSTSLVNAGGLVGSTVSITGIINSHADVTITGPANSAGGLIGQLTNNAATDAIIIDNCYAAGNLTGTGVNRGGLIGYCHNSDTGTINIQNNCYARGAVSGTQYTGGLIGYLNNETGTVTLVTIDNCYTEGDVSGASLTGGLAGSNSHGSISYCNAYGDVSGTSYTAGLTGVNTGTLNNCRTTGAVTGNGNDIGGISGLNNSIIKYCVHTTGEVTYTGSGDYVGGIAGETYGGSISFCRNEASVSGINYVGGIAGYSSPDSVEIKYSFATGNVSGTSSVGGLVGHNVNSLISNCYAKDGTVSGSSGGQNIGGLIGSNTNDINMTWNCYSACAVIYTGMTNYGGLAGTVIGTVPIDCFYNSQITGLDGTGGSTDAGSPKTTAEMRDIATYTVTGPDLGTPWDFPSVWAIETAINDGYPYLVANPPE